MATAAKISIAIEAQTATLQRGFDQARRSIQQLERGLSGNVARGLQAFHLAWLGIATAARTARGVFQAFFATVEQASAFQDWADRLGIAADDLAVLGYAAKQTGASQEILGLALERMSRNLADAAHGGGTAVQALKQLGITTSRLLGMAPDEQFRTIAAAIARVGTQAERTRLTLVIFGRGSGQLNNLINEGADGLARYAKEAENLGLKMGDARKYLEQFGDELQKTQSAWEAAKTRWAASWAVILADETEGLGKLLKQLSDLLFIQARTSVSSEKYKRRKAVEELTARTKIPGIEPATLASGRGFSAIQEMRRRYAEQSAFEKKLLNVQERMLRAIERKPDIVIQPVEL